MAGRSRFMWWCEWLKLPKPVLAGQNLPLKKQTRFRVDLLNMLGQVGEQRALPYFALPDKGRKEMAKTTTAETY